MPGMLKLNEGMVHELEVVAEMASAVTDDELALTLRVLEKVSSVQEVLLKPYDQALIVLEP